MARVTGVKNPHLFLDVVRATPEITYLMAGSGDLSAEIDREKPANLRVIGWAEASIVLSAVDLVVSTSDNEGMPITLIEAQLAGLPVVATNVGSSSEVISDGVTGVVTTQSCNEIVNAIESLVHDSSLRTRYGEAARIRAIKYFDPCLMAMRHADLYYLLGKK
jgi:glycosyltransferase involved in cell wall biosynthesis